jgi:Rad3-related DNA helicase
MAAGGTWCPEAIIRPASAVCACIRLRCPGGRLARTKNDTGFVVVLDHRIVTKAYGRDFIKALPDLEVVRDEYSRQMAP